MRYYIYIRMRFARNGLEPEQALTLTSNLANSKLGRVPRGIISSASTNRVLGGRESRACDVGQTRARPRLIVKVLWELCRSLSVPV